jgi:L-threonylcarbamoyladenylate synthase
MSARFDCADPAQLEEGLAAAEAALRRGQLVVFPTDTVYGVAAEAFDPVAVDRLLIAKGRGRDKPLPVLVGTVRAAIALVQDLGEMGKDLIDEFWPGGLTVVLKSSPTLVWDLGESRGTVAVRMPLNAVALRLLKKTGPLAVSGAKSAGSDSMPATVEDAEAQLGDSVAVYLDGGPCPGDVPSTIVDLTGSVPRLLRPGVISQDRLREVIPLAEADEYLADPAVRPDPVIPDEAGAPDSAAGEVDSAAGAADGSAGAAGDEPAAADSAAGAAGSVAGVPGEADETGGAAASDLTAGQNGAAPEAPGQVL